MDVWAAVRGDHNARRANEVLRLAEAAHWNAIQLSDRGRLEEALRVAKDGYHHLQSVPGQESYHVWGPALGYVLDDISQQLRQPNLCREELADLLRNLRVLRAKPGENPALDRVIRWLETRLG